MPASVDTDQGNRPNLAGTAEREAERLYVRFCASLGDLGVAVQTGVFGP